MTAVTVTVYALTDGELCDLHQLIRMRLLILMEQEPMNVQAVLAAWDQLKSVRRQLGLKEMEKL
jgi:hypothetical protein